MDSSVMGGGLLSSSTAGILELQPCIHRNERGHLGDPQISHHHQLQVINAARNLERDQSIRLIESKGNSGKGAVTTSEEDEPSFTEEGSEANVMKGKKGSSMWQRMKWNDNMVRLLITVVSFVGEDGLPEVGDGVKRKYGVLQKKGKWKTISKIMMERCCYVSPQQCEDKFNDLNKRYKRLNEILGRGTTCRVVESPVLLDSMHQLSTKMKDDVRKILSSKHLFYKEMCAYHNGQRIPNSVQFDLQRYALPLVVHPKDGNEFEVEEFDENEGCNEDDLDDNEDDDDSTRDKDADKMGEFGKRRKMDEENGCLLQQPVSHDNFGSEMNEMLQDSTKAPWEKGIWIKNRVLQVQEQRVTIQVQAFELARRRLKWQKYCSQKEKEMERLRLDNERMKIENERMSLQLRQKELEIEFKMSEASLNPGSIDLDKLQKESD